MHEESVETIVNRFVENFIYINKSRFVERGIGLIDGKIDTDFVQSVVHCAIELSYDRIASLGKINPSRNLKSSIISQEAERIMENALRVSKLKDIL